MNGAAEGPGEGSDLPGRKMRSCVGVRWLPGMVRAHSTGDSPQCALRFKLKPLLLQRDSLVLSLLAFSPKDAEWRRLQINPPAGFLVCRAAEVRTKWLYYRAVGATVAGAPASAYVAVK